MNLPLAKRTSWIFDLDGTLTLPIHDFTYIKQELSIPEGEDILGHLETLPPSVAQERHQRLDEIERELAEKATASSGVPELLDHLHGQGANLGILTRNTRSVALLTLTAIGVSRHFNRIHVLGRDEAPPKPDPSGICRLQQMWQAGPHQMVMVGDYLFDLQAGRSAGAFTIHVGRPDGQRWPDSSDLMVDSLLELKKRLLEDTL